MTGHPSRLLAFHAAQEAWQRVPADPIGEARAREEAERGRAMPRDPREWTAEQWHKVIELTRLFASPAEIAREAGVPEAEVKRHLAGLHRVLGSWIGGRRRKPKRLWKESDMRDAQVTIAARWRRGHHSWEYVAQNLGVPLGAVEYIMSQTKRGKDAAAKVRGKR